MGFVLILINNCKKDETTSKKDPVITWANPADIYFGTLLSSEQLNAKADVPGIFVYTPAIGTILNVGVNQDLKVDFTPLDSVNYNPVCKTVKINVNAKIEPIITWINPVDISFGTLLSTTQLNATADVPGTYLYAPAIGTKLNEGTNQKLKVEFTPTDIVAYDTASKTVKINVTPPITVSDADGNVYHTVTLGKQIWMVENLKTTKFSDGNAIPNVTNDQAWLAVGTPAYCWYENNQGNKEAYGALYNWHTVHTGKLCPTGWHVPSNEEWTTLESYLIANGYNYDGTTTGDRYSNNKLAKALASATGWNSSTLEGAVGNTDYPAKRNATGFTALPGGWRNYYGGFNTAGAWGLWWCSSVLVSSNANYRSMAYNYNYLSGSDVDNSCGISIRCLRDN